MVMGMPSAVMDLPTPRDISMVFVKQYYTLLNEAPDHVHRFYSQDSSFVHGGLERGKKSETKTAMGQKEINDRIQKLQFRDARTKIKQVDAHPTLAGGVVIQVSGQLSNNGAPMRPFMQTFVLAPQTTHNYYVYNDIFRYQDDLFSDDEDAGDGAAEADDEAEPESPPVQPPAAPAPAPAPAAATAPPPAAEQPAPAAPALAPVAAAATAPAGYGQPAHMNGHGASAAAAPAAAEPQPTPPSSPPPAPAAETVEPEPAAAPVSVSPQPRQPSPQPRQPSPQPVSNEPKTYANLFKASSGRPAAPRPAAADKDLSPPSRPAAAARPAAPAAAPAARPSPAAATSRAEPSDSPAAGGGDPAADRRRYGGHPDNHQIFVGNLPQDISNAELTEHFCSFGEVVDIKIHSSKPAAKGVTPRNYPNYGFIVFDSSAAVQQVLLEMPVKLSRQGGDEEHRLNIEKKQQQTRPGEGRGRGDRPGEGRGRGFYGRGAPRGRAGYGRGGEPRGGRGGYQSGPRR